MKTITDILDYEEGLRLIPYLCSEEYVTIGYGTLLHTEKGLNPNDFPLRINKETATLWLTQDVDSLTSRLSSGRKSDIFNSLNTERKIILISMAYQLGYSGLMGFNNMWMALRDGDWEEASVQALESKWYRQTPSRASRHAFVLLSGSLAMYDLSIDGPQV